METFPIKRGKLHISQKTLCLYSQVEKLSQLLNKIYFHKILQILFIHNHCYAISNAKRKDFWDHYFNNEVNRQVQN